MNHRLVGKIAQVVPVDSSLANPRLPTAARKRLILSAETSIEDYRWLIEGVGRKWLDQPTDASIPIHRRAAKLRNDLSPAQTHLIIEQHRLRERGRLKFPEGDRLFYAALPLEQATDTVTADYKASRFPAGERVADLCCGIGGDMFSIARRGPTCAFDYNESLSYLASQNAKALELADCSVRSADVTETNLHEFDAIHIDPDRRVGGRRSVQLENHAPSVEFLTRLIKQSKQVAVKLAPATDADHTMLQAAELEWIGSAKDCRQLVAWFGEQTRHPGKRVATILGQIGPNHFSGEVIPGQIATRVERFIIEPHPPVLAAELAGQLAVEHNLEFVTAGGGYLTGDSLVHSRFCNSYEVVETMPYRPKRIKKALSRLNVGHLVVKKRGVEHDPRQVQRDCQPADGDDTAVMFVTSIQQRVIAIITRRVESDH